MFDQTYFLVRFDTLDAKDDFTTLSSWLTNSQKFSVAAHSQELNITMADGTNPSILKLTSPTSFPGSASMTFQCDAHDSFTLIYIRSFAFRLKYRVYSTALDTFLPKDPAISHVAQFVLDEKPMKVLNTLGLTPIFLDSERNVMYVKHPADGKLHILNSALFQYFVDFETPPAISAELSYAVADTVAQFVAYYDEGLIPYSFYRYFGKKLTILNDSSFNIEFINRKVFLKPLFFVYSKERKAFVQLGPEQASINYADKVRVGESLHMALVRITKELGLAEGYEKARVLSKIDFDRDKEGVLTPRLWVLIYLSDVRTTPEVKTQMGRGWVSLAKDADK